MATPIIQSVGSLSGAGTAGEGRSDLVAGETVTLSDTESANSGSTYFWQFEDAPLDTAPTLLNPTTSTPSFVVDSNTAYAGSYRIKCTVDGIESAVVVLATPLRRTGGRVPSFQERLEFNGGGNTKGWHESQTRFMRKVDDYLRDPGPGAAGDEMIYSLWSGGRESHDATTPLVCGAFAFAPGDYSLAHTVVQFRLVVVAAVGGTPLTGHVQLYNVTDNEVVSSSAISIVNSTSPTRYTALLSVGAGSGKLKTSGERIYECRIYIDTPGGPVTGVETIELFKAEVQAVFTITTADNSAPSADPAPTVIVQDEGISVGAFKTLNFTGDGVSVTDAGGGVADVDCSGGGSGAGLVDGDYGDIVVSGTGTAMAIDAGAVDTSKLGGDITTAGKALLDDADAAAQRTTLGLGTAAVANTGDFDAAGAAATAYASAASDLATHAGVTTTHGISSFGSTLVDDANAAAARTTLGLGTAAVANTGDFDAAGDAAAVQTNLTTHTSSTTAHGISSFGSTLVDDANAAAARTTLGLGTAAVAASTDFAAAAHGHAPADITPGTNGDVLITSGGVTQWGALSGTLTARHYVFGSGYHGSINFDGVNTFAFATKSGSVYTLTQNIHATDMIVASGVTVITAGCSIQGTGTLSGSGTIKNNGSDGTSTSGGAGAVGNSLPGGTAGGDSAINDASSASTGTAASLAPVWASTTATTTSTAAAGGNGGTCHGGSGGGRSTDTGSQAKAPGSAGGTIGSATSEVLFIQNLLTGRSLSLASNTLVGGTGGGGGAASSSPSVRGGGGGGGGGYVVVAFYEITFTGQIEAKGGAGAAGAANSTSSGAAGGGGGGGGGGTIVCVIGKGAYPTCVVTGGAGGAAGAGTGGASTGWAGGNGGDGYALKFTVAISGGAGSGAVTDADYGDIVVSGTGTSWTIDTNVVSLAKLAQIATSTFLARSTAGTGNVEAITAAQATSIIAATSGDNTKFLRGDGTWAVPAGTGGSGGYKGSWSAGTYTAGSIVRRGPFLFGTILSTTQDPCIVEGNLGSNVDWKLNGSGSQSSTTGVMTLHTGTSQTSIGFRLSTNSGWHGRRLVVDALVGPSGAADYFNFGIYDGSLSTTASPSNGAVGVTGVYGVNVDFGSDRVGAVQNGSATGYNSYVNSAIGAGNDTLETSVYQRYYLDFVQSGGNLILTLYRDNFVLQASDNYRPGFVGTWTITAPGFTTWRFVVGSVQGGGSPGAVRVVRAWSQYAPTYGDWDLLGEFQHTPHIDSNIF